MLARALNDSANQKSDRPSGGGDIARLRPTSRVADFSVLHPAPRNAHPPSFTGASPSLPGFVPFRHEEARPGTSAGPAPIGDRPFNREGGCE